MFDLPMDFLRDIQADGLPDSCAISRPTDGTPTGDGTPESWATVATVACRVSPLASGSNEAVGGAEALRAVNQWTIWVPALTDVTVEDRIVYGSRTFEIVRVGARSYETVREIIAREIT